MNPKSQPPLVVTGGNPTTPNVSFGAIKAKQDFQTLRRQIIARLAFEKWEAKGRATGTALLDWLEAEREAGYGPGPDQIPACPYQVKGRLLTGEEAVICTQCEGSCPLQVIHPETGGRHTALCTLMSSERSELS